MRWSSGTVLAVVVLCGPARADEAAAVRMVEKLGGTVIARELFPDALERNVYALPDTLA